MTIIVGAAVTLVAQGPAFEVASIKLSPPPESTPMVIVGPQPGGQRRLPTAATPPPMAPVLGDVRRDRRQLSDLMTSRVADRIARVQGVLAMATRVRHEVDDRLHTLRGHERAMVPGMSRLATRLPSTFHAPTAHPL